MDSPAELYQNLAIANAAEEPSGSEASASEADIAIRETSNQWLELTASLADLVSTAERLLEASRQFNRSE